MSAGKITVALAGLLAVVLGLHIFLMIAFTVALAVALILAWRIDVLTMRTGWGLTPGGWARPR